MSHEMLSVPAIVTSEAARAYVLQCMEEMSGLGITIQLDGEEQVGFGGAGRLGGYFAEDTKTFFVGNAPSERVWLSVFMHERNHVRQWVQGSPKWSPRMSGDCCPWYLIDAWLARAIELTERQRDDAILAILECEVECEQMTLEEVCGRPELGIHPGWYASAANVYLAFHAVYRLTRRWYQSSPYRDDSLILLMPCDRIMTAAESMAASPEIIGAILSRVYVDPFTAPHDDEED